jgi:streptomycin 6-kinase
VRGKALAFGAGQWLGDLPDLIADLEQEWSITVGRSYPAASEALVCAAVAADGSLAVLKLCVPNRGAVAEHEITALRLINGEGSPRLLRSDVGRGALLLERLGQPMNELGLPIEQRHESLCAAVRRIWRPAPAGCGLPSGAEKGRSLIEVITRQWEELGRPCSERAVEHALACAARRIAAHDDERAVLVHGDVHEWNALTAPASASEAGSAGGPAGTGGTGGAGGLRFKLVDPDGLVAEPEYDLGVMMREDPIPLMTGDPRDRARWLARRCGGLDAEAVWEWGVVERVSTGLLCTQIGLQPVGSQMLAAADHLAEHHAAGPA